MTKPLFRLLGHLEWGPGASSSPRPTGQVAQFLAYLAYKGDWLGREELAFLFWPDQPDSVARRNLSTDIATAKAIGAASALVLTGNTAAGDVLLPRPHWVFEDLHSLTTALSDITQGI